ncbi:MAG: rod shape-determining protein [Firmicutes bacterium]|nr:rod shape-determining protein [Bacillota bacterium]
MARRRYGLFVRDMAIDLGTANSLAYVAGRGVVMIEPSVVAIDEISNEVIAVGDEAKRMIGRTPGAIRAVRPLKQGVIANFDMTKHLLRHLILRGCRGRMIVRPRVIVSVPAYITEVERRAVIDATIEAGARAAFLIEEPVSAAIGVGLPVQEPTGSMVVDIGGGMTNAAVISLGGIVSGRSARVGGDDMDEAIVKFVRRNYNLMIGERTAEDVKISIGSVWPLDEELSTEVRGRDYVTGLPKGITLSSVEVRDALAEPMAAIAAGVRSTLEDTPPELVGDIIDREIVVTGGGALLRGIDKYLAKETGIRVKCVDNPLLSVVTGAGRALEEIDLLEKVATAGRKAK